jgi:predicted histidine transporter YuiF (NhaC family)
MTAVLTGNTSACIGYIIGLLIIWTFYEYKDRKEEKEAHKKWEEREKESEKRLNDEETHK